MSRISLSVAARRFFEKPRAFRWLGDSSGLSGSGFAKVESDDGVWCLRKWPEGFSEERLRFIHRAMSHSRENGFAGIPELAKTSEGDTLVNLDGVLFEAQRWLGGEPLSGRPPAEPLPNVVTPVSAETISSLADAVGRFHLAARSAIESEDEKRTILAQFHEVARNVEARSETLLDNVRIRATSEQREVFRRWMGLLPDALALAEAALRRNPIGARSASVLCHGDLWPTHVYFDGGDFAGFTDFENVSFGSAVSDLAHLILHFNGWVSRDTVLSAYEKVAPLTRTDKDLLPVAAITDLAWEASWSHDSLYGENPLPTLTQKEAHQTNLQKLLPSLEQIVADLKNTVA